MSIFVGSVFSDKSKIIKYFNKIIPRISIYDNSSTDTLMLSRSLIVVAFVMEINWLMIILLAGMDDVVVHAGVLPADGLYTPIGPSITRHTSYECEFSVSSLPTEKFIASVSITPFSATSWIKSIDVMFTLGAGTSTLSLAPIKLNESGVEILAPKANDDVAKITIPTIK